jgi:hypothetical protein
LTSIRDITLNGSDLIVATHGRSFWVLDDIAPLRHATEAQKEHAYLYAPPTAVRVDNDTFLGTPLPPEEPQASNPPNGAILDYYLESAANKIVLQIIDAQGHVLRHLSSNDTSILNRPLLPIAERWFPKPEILEASAGAHRFVWDLASGGSGIGMEEDDENSTSVPPGPRVPPGTYTVRLIVDGAQMERPLSVTKDPRVTSTNEVLAQQFALANSIYLQTLSSRKAMAELESVDRQLKQLLLDTAGAPPDLAIAVHEAIDRLDEIKNSVIAGRPEKREKQAGLADANTGLGIALRMVESGHRTAPSQALLIFDEMSKSARLRIAAWKQFKSDRLSDVNAALVRAKRQPLQISSIEEQVHYAMTR